MGVKPKVDRYVCKIASMEEVNEKWDTLVREHPDDPNWAVWKKDIIAEISAGGEIPYYGILDGEIICEAYAVRITLRGWTMRDFARKEPSICRRFARSGNIAERGIFRGCFGSCWKTCGRKGLQERCSALNRVRF